MLNKVKLIVLGPYEDIHSCEHRPMQEAKFFREKGKDVEILIMQRKILGKGVVRNRIEGIPAKHFLCKTERIERLLKNSKIASKCRAIFYVFWFLKFIVWLRQELKKSQGCCLVAHNLEMAFAACMVNQKKKFSVVFVMREVYEGQVTNPIKKILIEKISKLVQNRSDYLVQVVPAQFEMTMKKNRKKILYIPNYPEAVNYADIKPVESDKIRINYIGSVRDVKSLKMLMDAAIGLEKIEIGIHGMGEAYQELKEIEKEYNNVKITGYYDYQTETKKLFSNTDIVYCAYNIQIPNWKVAYPIKLYESIETGIPVLLCRGMAPEKFVRENDCGYLFDYNVESLRSLLIDIQNDRESLKRKKASTDKLKGRYTWDKVVKEYNKIIA